MSMSHSVSLFLKYDDRKQYSATTTAHRKRLIVMLKENKALTASLITIRGKTDGFNEKYIWASAIYLMSVMSQCYLVILDRGVSAPGNGK